MKANKYLVPALVIGLLLATVGVAQATGYWIVSGKQMIDVEGMATTDDVRGWMTVEQIAQGFQLELATVYAITDIPTDVPADTALKDLETIVPDFEVTGVREALAAYLGEAPATDGEVEVSSAPVAENPPPPTALPTATVAAAPVTTPDHVPLGDGSGEGIGEGAGDGTGGIATDGYLAGDAIKGIHSLQTIAQQGEIDLDQLLAALGLPPDTDPATAVRSLVESGAIDEVATIRSVVSTLQQD